MIRIQVRPNEPLETALRRFKRQCNYAGIFRLAKKASVYEKPSEKRRREARERVRNVQRAVRKAMQARRSRRKPRRNPSQRPDATEPTKSADSDSKPVTSGATAKAAATSEA